MEKALHELQTAIERPEPERLTGIAQNIANTALGSFRGDLLSKALNISKAIIEYEDELNHAEKRT